MRVRETAALCSLLAGVSASCAGDSGSVERHLQRELTFFRAGVAIPEEREAVLRTLRGGGMHIVAESRGPGFWAVGAATTRFEQTAVRIVTRRGISAHADADRAAVSHPGRVHLLEDLPLRVGQTVLVGWLRIAEGRVSGCASLQRVDPGGFVRPVASQIDALGDLACLATLELRGGRAWGTVVWPDLGPVITPSLAVPLGFPQRALDDRRPPDRLVMREVTGWTGAAREARLAQVEELEGFPDRHALAVELAALALLDGDSAEAQRGLYTRYAGPARDGRERALFRETVAHIERGWLTVGAYERTLEPGDQVIEPSPLPAQDVLQDGGDGEEAQKKGRDPG